MRRFSTGNPWERSLGFSRAVEVGGMVYTAGTVAVDSEGRLQGETAYEQCCFSSLPDRLRRWGRLAGVLEEAGSGLDQVVKVTCFLVDKADAEAFGRAHFEHLGEIRPAATCVVVKELFGEGTRVEIELTATVRG